MPGLAIYAMPRSPAGRYLVCTNTFPSEHFTNRSPVFMGLAIQYRTATFPSIQYLYAGSSELSIMGPKILIRGLLDCIKKVF